MVVQRITMFKVPKEESYQTIFAEYAKLSSATKDGKRYILSAKANAALPDQRAQGYTIVTRTSFATLDDMRFYDDGCEAHKALKSVVRPHVEGEGVLTVYWEE